MVLPPEKVLQTIFSRCQSLRVLPLSKEEREAVRAMAPEEDREEYETFMELFTNLMNALAARDLLAALECGEQMASLDSREKQKAFCTFAGECIRKIFMLQQKLPQIAGISPEEEAFYADMAQKCGRKFCSKTVSNIEKVAYMIDRNVNSKILFCDLVNRMFFSI